MLTCNIEGCTYQTNRRRDMHRHKRSQKHSNHDVSSDSDSDFDRPPWECKLCSYITAKRFSFARHQRSERHRRNQLFASKDEDTPVPAKKVKESHSDDQNLNTSSEDSKDEGILYTCTTCTFMTNKKWLMKQHKKSTDHLEKLNITELENWLIEYDPQEEEDCRTTEPVRQETEDEDGEENIAVENCSMFECNICDYKTAHKFSFIRHKQSCRHLENIIILTDEEEVQKDLGFDVIDMDPNEELQEIVYVPTEENPDENCYHIVMDSD
ncbi:hypothetical protein KR026_002406 [Drosophila bipectinata]|nr:hypothetical protein KR026_002406 [Drosophila bipectinata]